METPRLRLYRIDASHLEGFHRIWSSPEATRWSSRGVCKTLEESREWMNGILSTVSPDGENYAVFVRSGEKSAVQPIMIGVVGVYRTFPAAELGYTFHPDFWGCGYASEAVSAFVNRFWELRPTVRSMIARTDSENYGSMKVLLKCGFQEVERQDSPALPSLGPGKREVVTFRIEAA